MADEADLAQEQTEAAENAALTKVRNAASKIQQGMPGECDLCGEWSRRLILGVCAPCRDKYHLK